MWIPSHVWSTPVYMNVMYTHVDRPGGVCIPRQGPHTGGDVRETADPPAEWPASKAAGKAACSRRAEGACSPLLCFLPSRALRPLPRHLRQSAKAAAAWPRASPCRPPTSLPLIHCQPWLTGKGVGRGAGAQVSPAVTPVPLAQGPPSRCSTGPSWPWMQTWTSTPW